MSAFVYDYIRLKNRIDVLDNAKIVTNNKGEWIIDNGTKMVAQSVGVNGSIAFANSTTSTGHEYRVPVAADISDFDTKVNNNTNVTSNTTHRGLTNNPHGVTKSQIGLSNVSNTKNNFNATEPPTPNEDSSDGYSVGSRWIDLSNDKTYVCVDSNAGIAVWIELTDTGEVNTSSSSGGISLVLPKNGVNFPFKGLTSSSKLSLIGNANDIGIDLVESNIVIGNLSGAPSGSVVGTSDSQVITNKTFTDNTTMFQAIGDTSSLVKFDLQYVSSSTTRTLIVPNANTTLVGTDVVQTLSSKSMNGDNNTFTNIVNSAIKAGAGIDASKLADGSVSNAEFQRLGALASAAVGISDTQTLSSKTLSLPKINNTSATHAYIFSVNELAANRNIILPLLSTDDTFVFEGHAQTLTGKTIDSDNNTILNIVNADIKSSANIDASKLANGSVSNAEFQRLSGVGSSVVGQSDTITLSNKKLVDINTYFIDSGDPTKKMHFYLDLIESGQTRTIIIPDANTTLVGTAVGQTLSNKTWGDNLDMNNNKIINVSGPTQANDVATKSYVDATAQGLTTKEAVRVKTDASLPAYTQSGTGVGATLTADANGPLADIDGVTLVDGDRILVDTLGSTSDVHNGIYKVTNLGDELNPWILTRTIDADADSEVTAGLTMFVTEGTTFGDNGFTLTTNDPITVDTTALTFTQTSGTGQIIDGAGIIKTGNQLDVGGSDTIIANANDLEVNSSGIANQILLSSGTVGIASNYGSLPLGNTNAVSGIVGIANGGTNASSFSAGSRIVATNSGNSALETTSIDPSIIVTTTGIQTLSNKILTDSTTIFQDETETYKQFKLLLSSLTTTRTLTVPDTNDTIAVLDMAQTFTSKTINADDNNITNITNAQIKSGATIDASKIANGTVSNTEFQRLGALTSAAVGISDTQTLTSKSFIDASTYFINNSTTSKKMQVDLSELTTDTTRILTIPDASDTLVLVTMAQTLTNKIINATNNTITNITNAEIKAAAAIDATKIANGSVSNTEFQRLDGVGSAIVGISDSVTFTNKSFDDSSTFYVDNIDPSKKMQFQLSGISTTNTRVITIPDSDITLVGVDLAQPLTNKTINSSQNTITNITNTSIKSDAGIDATKIADGTVSNTKFQRIGSLESNAVGVSDSQVLSNKTFTDATTYFQDDNINSKKIQFQLSNISVGTTRIVSFPDSDITVVGTNLSQILTTKTIDADSNTISNIANAQIKSSAAINATKIANGSVDNTAFQRLSAVGSAIVGVSDTQTLTSKTLTSPKIESSINDSNNNELVKLTSIVSAVNEITVSNASASNGPSIITTGNDINIDLNITSKGDGNLILDGLVFPNTDGDVGQAIITDGSNNLGFANVSVLTIDTLTTTDNIQTTIATTSTSSDNVYLLEASIIACRTDSGSEGGGFILRGFFRNNAGTLTKIGQDLVSSCDDTEWTVDVATSGTNIIIRVIGKTGVTINWKSSYKMTSVA